ncbi:MAG: sulfite exporter TauE/SafE family protein [Eubacteriales bacterium]|nr:sulfite exporter TauE/SafE family protein [Eubacteriales bacterium]
MASNIMQKKLQIGGMTCVNCQKKIERKLRGTAGIVKASVSYNTGTADITYRTDILSLEDISGVIRQLGYDVLPQNGGRPDTLRVAGTLAVIVCLYVLLQNFGILNLLVPSRLADTQMGYGLLFVMGLITSVHCVAMCGGINLSQCIPTGQDSQAKRGAAATLLPAVLYNLGRVISYTAIGFLLGLVGFFIGGGSEAGVPVLLQGILKLAAGICMVIMGVNMLGLFPRLRVLTLRPPKFLAAKINAQKWKSSRPLIVGLLNGLMPCGPLQSMQIVALASANPFAGALSMLLFSLGTVPLMLGLGSIVSVLGKKFTHAVTNVGAVLVVVLGLAMLCQGGSLSGLLQPDTLLLLILILCVLGVAASLPFSKSSHRRASLAAAACVAVLLLAFWGSRSMELGGSSAAEEAPVSDVETDVQVITSTLTVGRYPNITVQAGIPVKWIIDAPAGSINGCNYRMIVREYGIEHTFQEGENIIEFTPSEEGTFQYTCWMGMIRGSIVVTGESADGAA